MSELREALKAVLKDHRPPNSGHSSGHSTVQVGCSCGKWRTDLESDTAYGRRTGLRQIFGNGLWDRAKREHHEHILDMLVEAAQADYAIWSAHESGDSEGDRG